MCWVVHGITSDENMKSYESDTSSLTNQSGADTKCQVFYIWYYMSSPLVAQGSRRTSKCVESFCSVSLHRLSLLIRPVFASQKRTNHTPQGIRGTYLIVYLLIDFWAKQVCDSNRPEGPNTYRVISSSWVLRAHQPETPSVRSWLDLLDKNVNRIRSPGTV